MSSSFNQVTVLGAGSSVHRFLFKSRIAAEVTTYDMALR